MKPSGIRSLPAIAGRNHKVQATLLFSPEGTDYGNRYDTYDIALIPDDKSTAIVVWDMIYTVEGGAIQFYTPGNISLNPFDLYITSEMVRLGIASIRGNLPHYCNEHPIYVRLENKTPYEIDLTITIPALVVPLDFIHNLIAERLG